MDIYLVTILLSQRLVALRTIFTIAYLFLWSYVWLDKNMSFECQLKQLKQIFLRKVGVKFCFVCKINTRVVFSKLQTYCRWYWNILFVLIQLSYKYKIFCCACKTRINYRPTIQTNIPQNFPYKWNEMKSRNST